MCSVWIWEQTAIISLYSIDRLVCTTEMQSVYCAVRTGSLYIIQVMCFVWIWEQTTVISLHSINLSGFKTKTECLLRGTNWVFKSDSYSFVIKGLIIIIILIHNMSIMKPNVPLCSMKHYELPAVNGMRYSWTQKSREDFLQSGSHYQHVKWPLF